MLAGIPWWKAEGGRTVNSVGGETESDGWTEIPRETG